MSQGYQTCFKRRLSGAGDCMIKEIISALSQDDYGLLMYAFEEDMSKVIILKDNKWIAVNLRFTDSDMIILEDAGSFSYGEYQCSS